MSQKLDAVRIQRECLHQFASKGKKGTPLLQNNYAIISKYRVYYRCNKIFNW